jgi:ssRNA-specific RNase YbeY (16S rRNA maturation enzyme)
MTIKLIIDNAKTVELEANTYNKHKVGDVLSINLPEYNKSSFVVTEVGKEKKTMVLKLTTKK